MKSSRNIVSTVVHMEPIKKIDRTITLSKLYVTCGDLSKNIMRNNKIDHKMQSGKIYVEHHVFKNRSEVFESIIKYMLKYDDFEITVIDSNNYVISSKVEV